jgi:hypothetical protein
MDGNASPNEKRVGKPDSALISETSEDTAAYTLFSFPAAALQLCTSDEVRRSESLINMLVPV